MLKKFLTSLVVSALAFAAGTSGQAQPSYSNTVMSLSPAAYWPLNETAQPPSGVLSSLTAVNLGTLGAAGNGYYGAWYQPSGNTFFITNNVVQTNGATVDGDKAMNCQFAPGQYVVLPRNTNGVANSAITIMPPFSIETWVNAGTTASRLGTIVSEGQVQLNAGGPNTNDPFYGGPSSTTAWAGFALGQYANFFFFSCYNTNAYNVKSSELDSPHTIVVGQWVHLVVTFDGTTETMYENGVSVGTKKVPANAAGLTYVPDPTSPLMIGSGSDVAVSYGTAWTGGLDEVAIYNSILPTSSIQAHYQTAFGTNATYGANYSNAVLADSPLIYFRLDDAQTLSNAGYPTNTFPVANNYGSLGASGNGLYQPGTTPGVAGPSYAGFGADSKGVAINGWFGAVDVGNSNIPAALNPTGTAPLTLVSWFKTGPADAPGRFQEIVGHSDSSYRLSLGQVAGENHFNPGPGPELQFTAAADVASNGFAFNDGQWHMVAGVTDGTNEFMYLDGVLAKSSNNPAGINIAGTTRDLLLGGDPQYTAASDNTPNTIRDFNGDIAQVAYWTNALTGAQISELFNAAGVPPYITIEPIAAQTNNGNTAVSILAGARGSAPMSLQWYQGSTPVSGQTNGSLTFASIQPGNAGSYALVASNAFGSVTSSVVTLTVIGAPVIEAQTSTDVRVFAGSSPTLRVTAEGAPPLTYQWSNGSGPISGATNPSLTLPNIQSGGTFTCLVGNSFASVPISPITVTVLSDPTAPFPVKVLDDAPIAYYRLDETTGTTAYDYVGGDNATYTNVVLGQPGYTSEDPIQSDPTEAAVEFGDFPPDNNFAGNVPPYVNFATNGNGEFSVEAWFTEYLFLNGGNCVVAEGYGNGGEQFVLDTGAGTKGSVRFFVRNAAGTSVGASGTYVPANDGKWHHMVGVCDEANGKVLLYLDGALAATASIPVNSGILGSTTPLTIGARESGNNPGTNDFQFLGKINDVAIYNYPLTAAQVANHFLASGIAPTITSLMPSNSVTTNQGSSVTLSITTAGTAPIGIQWFDINNNPISGATNASLTLAALQPSQSGNYGVTVSNIYGTASTNVNLNVVLGPPAFTENIEPTNATAFAGDPVTLGVSVSGSQPISYQWFRDGLLVSGATNSSYTFPAIVGTSTYFVVVTNAFSVSQGSGPLTSAVATVVGEPISTVNPSSFTSSMKITFSGYTRSETLSDFPVLVRLGTNIPGFSYSEFASATGGDLRFAASNGTRELPYEVDQWNDSNGISSVWVQVPSLASSNDFIWAYWGNTSNTTAPDYTTNGSVWVPPSFLDLPAYDIVYHLKESGFPYADSTTNYPALRGVAPVPALGIVGTGEAFNGTSSFLDAGIVTNLDDEFTLSAWVNIAPSAQSIQTIWANQKGGYGSAGFSFFVDFYQSENQAVLVDAGDGVNGSEPTTVPGLVTFGQWHLVSAAMNRTNGTVQFNVDGTPEGTSSIVANFTNDADVNLGCFTNLSLFFTGTMDEARIHAGIDSTNWTWASWMTVASNATFQTYGALATTGGPVTIAVQKVGGNLVLTWPQGTLQSSSMVNGTYADVPGATSPFTVPISGAMQFYRVRVR